MSLARKEKNFSVKELAHQCKPNAHFEFSIPPEFGAAVYWFRIT